MSPVWPSGVFHFWFLMFLTAFGHKGVSWRQPEVHWPEVIPAGAVTLWHVPSGEENGDARALKDGLVWHREHRWEKPAPGLVLWVHSHGTCSEDSFLEQLWTRSRSEW